MDLVRGGVDFRGDYVSKILYVKTKELGPLGGRVPGTPPLDPPMKRSVFFVQGPNDPNTHMLYIGLSI